MTTKRRPIKRPQTAQITPAAVDRWQRMRALQRACTCPDPASAPYPGRVFNSADSKCMARHKVYEIERARYEAKRAACNACPQWKVEHEALLGELGISLKPWQLDIYDCPRVIEALDAAIRGMRRARRKKVDQPETGTSISSAECDAPKSGAEVMFLVRRHEESAE